MDKLKCQQLSEKDHVDRLSPLHEDLLQHIFSQMPTRYAAHTSLISSRFRNMWKESPVISFTRDDIRDPTAATLTKFIAMLKAAINSRNPSIPLLRLNIQYDLIGYNNDEVHPATYHDIAILELLVKAHSFGLRHLTLSLPFSRILHMLPTIFTFDSLESLSLPSELIYPIPMKPILPTTVSLTRLRNLSLNLKYIKNTEFNQFISKLSSLEDLQLVANCEEQFTLSSKTIRKLNLEVTGNNGLNLDLPSLELLRLDSLLPYRFINQFEVKLPSLKKANVSLCEIDEGDASTVMELLRCLSHADELCFRMSECSIKKMPYHVFLDPDKDVPIFSNLKYLEVTTCFHELNCKDVITLVRNSPALRILKLSHKVIELGTKEKSVRKFWRSKLPRNLDGNYRYGYFINLNLDFNRGKCIQELGKRLRATSIKRHRAKRLKLGN